MDIKVRRIETKFKEYFTNLIDMEDFYVARPKATATEIHNAFLSRCLAAYAIVMKTDCDFDVASAAVTDGFNDNGIDAIYVDKLDKQIYIIQSKWINDGKASISQGDTLKFTRGIEQILALEFDNFNDKVKAREEELTKVLSDLEYHLNALVILTSMNGISDECKDVLEKQQEQCNAGNIDLFTYECILMPQIYERLVKETNSEEIVIKNLILNNWGYIELNDNAQGYYGLVCAETVADWWKKYGSRLLDKNIRNFRGDTEVNKGMMDVLCDSPALFCLYNNGIKIVAQNITKNLAHSQDKKVGSFILHNASIVNGAQTYGSIGGAFTQNPIQTAKASVFVEIISLSGLGEEVERNITKLSNKQNRIENKDFVAMDPLQEKLRQDLLFDKIEYIYKTGNEEPSLPNYCTLDEVTVSLGCYLSDITVSANMKKAFGTTFEQIDKPPYTLIFNSELTTYLLWNCVKLQRQFEQVIERFQKKDRQDRLIAIHGNRFLLHSIFQIYNKKYDFNKEYLADTNFSREHMTTYIESLISEVAKAKAKLYPDAYAANLFKNASRCRELEKELDYIAIMQSCAENE